MNDDFDNAITDRGMLERSQAAQGATTTEPLDGEDLINIEDVTARIADLEAHDCHRADFADWCADYECASCDDGSGQELTALRELLAEMEPVKAYAGRASAIRDSYTDMFVRDEIDDVCGSDAVAILGPYVDWDTLTGESRAEMTETTFGGTTYYITS